VSPPAGLDYHLVHTIIPVRLLANSLGIFCDNTPSPSLFCRGGFKSRLPRAQLAGFLRGIADVSVLCLIHHAHSRQATLPPAPHHVSAPSSRSSLRRSPVARIGATATFTSQASSKGGSSPACHCGSPFLPAVWGLLDRRPNPQQQPPIGHRRPPPETSSMCPRRIFRPAFREGSTD
jgi:hypothetical protein